MTIELLNTQELREASLVVSGRLVDASNATLYGEVTVKGTEKFPVVYKPIAGERPLWDFPDGNLASREVAAYLISTWLDFGCVPPTVLRDGPYGTGAVQQWIEIDETVDVIELGQSTAPGLRKLALLDVVINNTDRKFGHILPARDGAIFGCDHGVTFHSEFKLRTVIWQFAQEPLTPMEISSLEKLLTFLQQQGNSQLAALLTTSEISALEGRIQGLIDEKEFPLPSADWPAVPWPPV